MRIAVFLVAILFPLHVNAQRLLTRGSASQQQALIDAEANWHSAKKLSVLPLPSDMRMPTEYGMDPDTMVEGQVGKLDYWGFKVLSVVDPKNCILSLGSRTIWLSGFPTKGLVDDQSVRLIGPVKVGSTRTYGTAGGASRTVRVVKFVSAEDLAAEEEEAAKRKAAIEQAEIEASFTTWTSSSGTTIEARFVDWKAGKIELKDRSGKSFFVTTSQLDDTSAEKARKRFKELRAKK